MPNKPQDYYDLLNIPRSATQDEIRRAYLFAAKQLHPDKNTAPGETELFLEVHQAYQVLGNPERRSAYDDTLPPEKTASPVFWHKLLFSRHKLNHLSEKQLAYLLLEIVPTEDIRKHTNSTPINVCLVLDTSTSMKGEKLDMVAQTSIQLINSLREQDFFSVVTFNDRAKVIIPATRNKDPHAMASAIQHIQTSGGTEILKGLQLGLQEVNRYSHSQFINHIILLTDGRTYGDEQSCYDLAKEAARQNVTISGLGIGNGWNDIFLDHLTSLTGGCCMMVSLPRDIEEFLKNKFFHLSRIVAPNITLSFDAIDGVEISYIFRIQPESGPIICENKMRLGSLFFDTALKVLIEFTIHPQKNETGSIELAKGRLGISTTGFTLQEKPIPINIHMPIIPNANDEIAPQEIIQALSVLSLYRLQEKARDEVANGEYRNATQHLQQLATHLLAQGEDTLAQNILFEKHNIEQHQAYSKDGEKQIKYGTRALFFPLEKAS